MLNWTRKLFTRETFGLFKPSRPRWWWKMRREKIVARWFTVLKACRNKLQPVDYRLNKIPPIKRHDQVFFVFRGLCKAIHPLRKKFSFPYLIKEQVVLSLCFFISKLWNHHALLTLQERARVSLQIYQVCDQIMILTVSCSEFRSFFTSSQHKSEVMKNMKAWYA